MEDNKALGLDGYNMGFDKEAWDIIVDDNRCIT